MIWNRKTRSNAASTRPPRSFRWRTSASPRSAASPAPFAAIRSRKMCSAASSSASSKSPKKYGARRDKRSLKYPQPQYLSRFASRSTFTSRRRDFASCSRVAPGVDCRSPSRRTTTEFPMADQQAGAAAPRRESSGAEESARLSALRGYCVLDTGREARFDDLTCLAASICETPFSFVSLVDTNRLFFKSAHGMDVRELPYPDFFCSHAIRQRDVFMVHDALQDPRFANHPLVVDGPRVRFYAGAPLVTPQDLALGTLCVVDVVPRQLGAKQIETLRILARQAMCQLELNLQAMRDPLTSLYNRRQLEESLHREVLRARRGGAPVGVMAIDVDHFKRVNDTLGHEVGDSALRGVAEVLSSCVREEDIACRAGGEEFVIILPGTD